MPFPDNSDALMAPIAAGNVCSWQRTMEIQMVRGLGLWMLGVPISIIVLIALFTGFI